MQSTRVPDALGDDARIPVVFRVGVTGHRWVQGVDAQRVVGTALEEAFARCSNHSTRSTPVGTALVSSLAEGADRLAADWAVANGVRLEVVLPLEPPDYVTDFATEESVTDFRRLLSAASAVTVVPPQVAREDGYRAAGSAVVERSDVLLAVWDGLPARGGGGTGEVVAAAARWGVPVSWVRAERHADGREVFGVADVRDAGVEGTRQVPDRAGPLSDADFEDLDEYNRRAVRVRCTGEPGPDGDPLARSLSDHHERADRMAVRARDAMLWDSRALYALAVAAVALAAGQLVFFPHEGWLGWFEVAALLSIMGVLFHARRSRLLDRWISTRVLAERLRSGSHLAAIGATPVPARTRPDGEAPTGTTEWAWRAATEVLLRTAARNPAPVDLEAGRAALLERWLGPQLAYQRDTEELARRREERSDRVTVTLFGVSLAAALLHVLELKPEGAPEYLTFLAVVAPAAAAAVSGYTGHREYVRQRLRAGRMVRELTAARASVVRAATVPELRRAAEAVDLVMQGESADWLAVTRLHELRIP